MKLLLTIFAVLLLLTGCGAEDAPTYRQVSSDEAAAMMASESDYLILDVRTREEYEQGHIPGAVCVPNESIGSGELSALPRKDQLILIYCRSGNRSKQAAQKLADAGYTNIVEFGGILSWTGETISGSEGE